MTVSEQTKLYGGSPESYALASKKVMQIGLEMIRQTRQSKDPNYSELFATVLKTFEAARAKIAKDDCSADAEQFGRSRLDPDVKKVHYYTCLNQARYKKYSDLAEKLILSQCMAGEKLPPYIRPLDPVPNHDIAFYRDNILPDKTIPKDAQFVAAECCLPFGDKWIPSVTYITMRSSDTAKQGVLFRHMDKHYISTCMREITSLFERIMMQKSPTVETVKGPLAEFRLKSAHCMPHERGSAAIFEWMERTIVAALGLQCNPDKDKMTDCEALVRPDTFEEDYAGIIHLENSSTSLAAATSEGDEKAV